MQISRGSLLVGLLIGVACSLGTGIVLERSSVRERNFATLARDIAVARDVAKVAPSAAPVASRTVEADLRIIGIRYSSLTAEERRLLELTRQDIRTGLLAVSPESRRVVEALLAAG